MLPYTPSPTRPSPCIVPYRNIADCSFGLNFSLSLSCRRPGASIPTELLDSYVIDLPYIHRLSRCNLTMAVRSRSSLHVRQDSDLSLLPPPSKRPRLQPHLNPLPPPSSSRHLRRGSSPDLLDTTIEPTASPKPFTVRPANSPLSAAAAAAPLPRASARRPRLISSTSSSSYNHHSPPPAPSSFHNPRTPHIKTRHDTPSTTPVPDPRESPDPLDTISPAPAICSPRPCPSPAVRESRQHHQQQPKQQHKIEDTSAKNPVGSAKASRSNAGRNSRRNNSVPPPESQQPPGPAEPTPAVRERRSLRSHDSGPKFRSELAAYFPNYDQLLSLEPQKTGMLRTNCVLLIGVELTGS